MQRMGPSTRSSRLALRADPAEGLFAWQDTDVADDIRRQRLVSGKAVPFQHGFGQADECNLFLVLGQDAFGEGELKRHDVSQRCDRTRSRYCARVFVLVYRS